jgi:hypothetical protein
MPSARNNHDTTTYTSKQPQILFKLTRAQTQQCTQNTNTLTQKLCWPHVVASVLIKSVRLALTTYVAPYILLIVVRW